MHSRFVPALTATFGAAALLIPAPALAGTTLRASLSNAGFELNAGSSEPSLSADGRYVGFVTAATGVVSGDTNGVRDVFVRDRTSKKTVRISVSSSGAQANAPSAGVSVSRTGRYVVFSSAASSLVSGDTNSSSDVFVRDRDTDGDGVYDEAGAVSTRRMSRSSAGAQANGSSAQPAISSSRYVAFSSSAENLVANDTNGVDDVFVRDRTTSRTVRVSVSTSGAQTPDPSGAPAISSSGRFIAFITDLGGTASRVFVRDRDTDGDGIFDESGAVRTIRVPGDVIVGTPSISADGRHVTFNETDQDDGGRVFVHDLRTGRTTTVSVSNIDGTEAEGDATRSAISGNGRYVAFDAGWSGLVAGDTNGVRDVFIRDRDTDADGIFDEPGAVRTTRASVSSADVQGNGLSENGVMAANGNLVAFESDATNLSSATDSNGARDIFTRTNP